MILSLRQRHRRIFVVLAALLPLAFALGVAGRRQVSHLIRPPVTSSSPTRDRTRDLIVQRGDLFDRSPVRARFWREHGTGRVVVGLEAGANFLEPDLLVYWTAERGQDRQALPADARLLGVFFGEPLPLPVEAAGQEGFLVLYSLADQRVVDISRPVRVG